MVHFGATPSSASVPCLLTRMAERCPPHMQLRLSWAWWEWRPHFQTSEPFSLRETNISQALANLAQPESRKAELVASQSCL